MMIRSFTFQKKYNTGTINTRNKFYLSSNRISINNRISDKDFFFQEVNIFTSSITFLHPCLYLIKKEPILSTVFVRKNGEPYVVDS